MNLRTTSLIVSLLLLVLIQPCAQIKDISDTNDVNTLSLRKAITMASDSSLEAFIAENNFLSNYWRYKNYKSQKYPFLNLNSTPLDYRHTLQQEYNSIDTSYNYISKQVVNSYLSLSLNQNVTKTGGKIYIDSDIASLHNLNRNSQPQYSATLIRLGIEQELFGFNPYKWEDMMEPIRYEKSKKELIESIEKIAVNTVDLFFSCIREKVNLEIALKNQSNADTLYNIGVERFEIASISKEDLYTLHLNLINAETECEVAKLNLNRARMKLNSFLRFDIDAEIELVVPDDIPLLYIEPTEALIYSKQNNPEIQDYVYQLLEAKKEVERTKKESRFSAKLNASFGLNQTSTDIVGAYRNPLDQEIVMFELSIPLIDWGLAKGKYNLAKKEHEVLELSIQQKTDIFEENIITTVNEFNIQHKLVEGAAMADTIASFAYDVSKERFILGDIDITKLNSVQSSSIEARKRYIDALETYWYYYYMVRLITLYDWERSDIIRARSYFNAE
jgi:outer membrane protein TolC